MNFSHKWLFFCWRTLCVPDFQSQTSYGFKSQPVQRIEWKRTNRQTDRRYRLLYRHERSVAATAVDNNTPWRLESRSWRTTRTIDAWLLGVCVVTPPLPAPTFFPYTEQFTSSCIWANSHIIQKWSAWYRQLLVYQVTWLPYLLPNTCQPRPVRCLFKHGA